MTQTIISLLLSFILHIGISFGQTQPSFKPQDFPSHGDTIRLNKYDSKNFKIKVVVYYYPTPISTTVILTRSKLEFTHSTPKKITTFSKALSPSAELQKLTEINFERLKNTYSNPCIDDGLGLAVYIEKRGRKKYISLGNYYQNEIGQIIEFINTHLSTEDQIWYDKEKLTKDYLRCMSK